MAKANKDDARVSEPGKNEKKNILNYNLAELEKEAAIICGDFRIFCDYVIENKVKLSKGTGNIGRRIALR